MVVRFFYLWTVNMNKKMIACIGFLMCVGSCNSLAYVPGGTNLSYGGYPDFSEMTPSKPFQIDEFSFNSYKMDVKRYVRKSQEFVENGDNDIKRIREQQQDAIDKANRVINEFNSWARSGF